MTIQEKVAAIEKFPFWLNTKSELLLVIAGLKPAITVSVDGKTVSCEQQTPLPSIVRTHAIENLLRRINIPFTTLPKIHRKWPEDDEQYYVTIICIGNSQKDADDLASVWTKITKGGYPASSQDAEHGRLSGFPKTAIEAFVNSRDLLLTGKEVDERTDGLAYKNFCQMRFTREYWREELKTPELWAKTVNAMSPKIYATITAKGARS